MYVKKFLFTFSFVLIALISYLYFVIFATPTIEKDIRSQYLKAGDFELILDGQPFKLSQMAGKPVVLYFGYTSCPDVCPVGLANIRDALNSSEKLAEVHALFVTLDPERDTSEKLRSYVSFFHENILPLRGSAAQIKVVIEAYGGFYRHVLNDKDVPEKDYVVDHSAYYYLINSNGELMRVFDHSVLSTELAKSLESLL